MKTYVLASQNKHKANEIKQILGEDFNIITMDEAGLENFKIIEDGKTFEENASKKASQVFEKLGIPTIADDSGLCVEYLGGRPGIYTARFAGENATDEMNINKLLSELEGVEFEKRRAEFVCAIALIEKSAADIKIFKGICPGYIITERRGNSGFGYDPVFYYPEYKATLAEIGDNIKNKISHRYKALKNFSEYLKMS